LFQQGLLPTYTVNNRVRYCRATDWTENVRVSERHFLPVVAWVLPNQDLIVYVPELDNAAWWTGD